ncbi:DNA polymerase III subunit chi [Propionivibrio limicola]|uniref:DNA polymerase III subunit chi n=1 Tax=Propionivibrio limicola TaxID=167645 RepID=UPI001290D36F|nr:DNA polymerase III subunit chi [Propionivibrio limicola]
MTRIFFYHGASDRIAAMATLIGKTCKQKKALLVYAPDKVAADGLDRRLWTHPPTSFTPHVRGDSPLAPETPVVITDALDGLAHNERLFNLSNDIPPGFSRFTSVIEVVGQEGAERLAGRERVKFYKDRGYEIHYVNLAE